MGEVYYKEGKWVKVETIGDLREALSMFPDNVSLETNVRFLETMEEDCDGRSTLSIQIRKVEIEAY